MPHLSIDGRTVEAAAHETVLEVARRAGVAIPTLCHADGLPSHTSCMVCVVRDEGTGRFLPSCAYPVHDGLAVDTRSDAVRQARRNALELLLSDHVGDCEAPCERTCPARVPIPRLIRQVQAGDLDAALRTMKSALALPAVLGRICPAPCEKACRRGAHDAPVAICRLRRHVADADLADAGPWRPPRAPPSGRRVAIAGAGPCGLSAAYYLLRAGHACELLDPLPAAGGRLRDSVPRERLPLAVLDAEVAGIAALGATFRFSTALGRDVSLAELEAGFDAVILAFGRLDAAGVDALGLSRTSRGLAVDAATLRTGRPNVFAGGDAVHASRLAVRACGDGRRLAGAVDRHLRGESLAGPPPRFNSRIGRLLPAELERMLAEVSAAPRAPETAEGAAGPGLSSSEAVAEAGRCLRCDCRKADTCALRRHAAGLGARQDRFRGDSRREWEARLDHPLVRYEPGKCIRCGLCIRIARRHAEPLGLAFIGRGFDVRADVPFGEPLREGLRVAARECIEACPTAALSRHGFEDGQG